MYLGCGVLAKHLIHPTSTRLSIINKFLRTLNFNNQNYDYIRLKI